MTGKLERLASAALLDAALRNDQILAEVINMFGKVHVHHEDELERQFNRIRDKNFRKAVETILSSRREELARRVDRMIDRVIGADDRNKGQHEEGLFSGTISSGENGAPAAIRRHPTRARSSRHTPGLRSLLRDLELLAALGKPASHGTETKSGGDTGKTHAVEHNGQMVEMDENEYWSYLRRRHERQTKEVEGHHPDTARQSGLAGTNKAEPVPPGEDED